jgi:hypothetical protein
MTAFSSLIRRHFLQGAAAAGAWGARSPKKLLLFDALRDPLKYGKNPSETC